VRTLSKSKLLSFRQCPKRLWLEIYSPELRQDSPSSQAAFEIGHQVGELAQRLYDPEHMGALIDAKAEGFEAAFARTRQLLASHQPIFEAGFNMEGALAFADVLLPVQEGEQRTWRMVEVKASSKVKDYHRDDVAIQAHVAKAAGVPLSAIALAHINSAWVCPGDGDLNGLLVEEDLTPEAFARSAEVQRWIEEAQQVASLAAAPDIRTGKHCKAPFECGFINHCRSQEPAIEHPITWLPRSGKLEDMGLTDLAEAPDDLLNDIQRRVRDHTLSGTTYFDAKGAKAALSWDTLPAYFLDFETINFTVPFWKGTRPYQQIPFQFSVHQMVDATDIKHVAFLDLSGKDPSEACAIALIDACGDRGPVYVYNQGFEKKCINDLASRYPRLAPSLLPITDRLVDLLPIARAFYYHPSQQGSWSIKRVLPAVFPDLSYAELDGINDGGMAMTAYNEATSSSTDALRKAEIEKQLLAYCKLDTLAMVRLWSFFSGQPMKD